jgi:hypothetical protein
VQIQSLGLPGGVVGGLRTRLASRAWSTGALIGLGPTLVVASALVLTVLAVVDLFRPLQ